MKWIAALGIIVTALCGCRSMQEPRIHTASAGEYVQSGLHSEHSRDAAKTTSGPPAIRLANYYQQDDSSKDPRSEDSLDRLPDETSGNASDRLPEKTSENKPEKKPGETPDKTSEEASEKTSEVDPDDRSDSAPLADQFAVDADTHAQDAFLVIVDEYSSNEEALAELEQMALATSPAVSQIHAEIAALRGKLTQSGLPPNPTAGFAGEDINEDGGAGRYGVYFGREIVRGNKLGLSQSVVCAEIQAAEQRLVVVQQRLRTDVRKRYYDMLVAQAKVAVATELVAVSQKAVDASEELLKAKEVAKTAVFQSELELQNANVVQRQAMNQQLAARRKLAGLIGETNLPTNSVSGNVHAVRELDDFEQTFDHLVSCSPEIAVLHAQVDQARRQLARECVEPVPNITWQTNLLYDTAGDDVVAGFQVGMPIPTLNRNQGAIYQARHQIMVAQRKTEKKALDIRQRLANAYEMHANAKLQVDAYKSEILPKAKQTFELVSQGYSEGEIDFLQLLTAQRTYSRISLTYLENLRQLWRQHVVIQGMLLDGSLN